jgi:signal transduction histidine kinase
VTTRRCVLVGAAVLAAAWILGAEWSSIHAGVQENHLLDALVGGAFVGAGLVAIDRRPGNAIGPLMVAFGAVGYVANWNNLGTIPLFPTLALASDMAGAALIANIAFVYPSGHLSSRFDRGVLWITYGTLGATTLLAVLTLPRPSAGCDCAWTPLFAPNPSAFSFIFELNQRLAFVLVPLFLIAVVLRWRRASGAERRALRPLWIAVALLAVVFLISAFAQPSPDTTSDPFAYLMWELRGVIAIAVPILFVWGLLSERLARSAVGDLVVELDKPMPAEDLEAALARTLRDPTLRISYAIGGGRWVDCDGKPVPAPAEEEAPGVTLVERDTEVLAALAHDPAIEPGLVQAAGVAAGMAIANERLRAEVRAQLEEVRASRRRIVEAGDAARRRVERDLHDGAQQRLVGLSLGLRMLEDRCRDVPGVADDVETLQTELRAALKELRELARGLHPQILTEEGLGAAVESLADRSPVPVRVTIDHDERLPAPVEATAYFVVAEALTNVSKYAGASSAAVAIARSNGSLLVDVTDDGAGGATIGAGSGLLGLEDRVAALGGTIAIESPVGEGTRLHAEIPCA